MRATVERSHLLRSLSHVHRVVERRNTIPILSNVLIRADGGRLMLKATDLDLEITETVPAEIGRRFGGRDHTTVLHAVRKIEGLVARDTALSEEVESLKRQLQE